MQGAQRRCFARLSRLHALASSEDASERSQIAGTVRCIVSYWHSSGAGTKSQAFTATPDHQDNHRSDTPIIRFVFHQLNSSPVSKSWAYP